MGIIILAFYLFKTVKKSINKQNILSLYPGFWEKIFLVIDTSFFSAFVWIFQSDLFQNIPRQMKRKQYNKEALDVNTNLNLLYEFLYSLWFDKRAWYALNWLTMCFTFFSCPLSIFALTYSIIITSTIYSTFLVTVASYWKKYNDWKW